MEFLKCFLYTFFYINLQNFYFSHFCLNEHYFDNKIKNSCLDRNLSVALGPKDPFDMLGWKKLWDIDLNLYL